MPSSYLHKRIGVFLLLFALAGCDAFMSNDGPGSRPGGTIDESSSLLQDSTAMKGTVGELTYIQGMRGLQVRGFGLVRGLGNNGSKDCPASVRAEIIRELRRIQAGNLDSNSSVSVERLLDSKDTAAVVVEGIVPFGMKKGQHFDVSVRAIDSKVSSVSEGYLIQCDLKIYKDVSMEDFISGKVHAHASGPIFVNPFAPAAKEDSAAGPREGVVIGGGRNLIDRRLSLVAMIESYSNVRKVMDVINSRFKSEDPIANAVSPTNINLRIPPEYKGKEQRFLNMVMYLSLSMSPIQREARANTLIGELAGNNISREAVSLALEGIGKSVIPLLQRMYTDSRREVNYYASRTGLRLGDEPAMDVVINHAKDVRSPFRLQAIQELGLCSKMPGRSSKALSDLLMSPDARIRVLAYESLRKINRNLVIAVGVGKESRNFVMDIVRSEGPTMIYASRSRQRRIALIGGSRLVFKPPLLYSEKGRPVTLSAAKGDRKLTVMRKDKEGNIVVKPFKVPLSVAKLVQFMGEDPLKGYDGRLEGLGIDYMFILDMLYRLCEKGAINADFRWEELSVEEMFGPLEPIGRPESEL